MQGKSYDNFFKMGNQNTLIVDHLKSPKNGFG